VSQVIANCNAKVVKVEDQCEYIYQAYKCIWEEIKVLEDPQILRFFASDVMGFSRLYDEDEIRSESEELTS